MKTIILYKSFLGTTKTYAKWLQEELNSDIKEFSQVSDKELQKYELVIVSSGTYAYAISRFSQKQVGSYQG